MSAHVLHFVALAGSLRRGSYARAIAATLDELAPDDVGVEVVTALGDLPLFNQDLEDAGIPPAVLALAKEIAAADALIIVTPEYNHSVPGVLKNAIDWLSRVSPGPLARKPVAVQSSSPGLLGGARAVEHLRLVLASVDSLVLNTPEVIVTQVKDKVDPNSGLLRDERTRQQISRQLQALTELVRTPRDRAA